MRKTVLVLLTVLIAAAPCAVQACDIYQPPEMKIGRNYDAVVVATISSADYTRPAPTRRPWRATAKLKRVVEGGKPAASYIFSVYDNAPACRYWQPIAVSGEDWVLYLRKQKDAWVVQEAYPLSLARKIDRRFTKQP